MYAWYVVAVLHLATLGLAVNVRIFTLVIEPIRSHFGVGDTAIGLLIGLGFALFSALSGLALGRLADRFQRAAILLWSTVLFSLCGTASGLVSTFALLFMTRVGVGVGRGGLLPAGSSLLSDYFPPERRGLAISMVMTGNRLGAGLALLVGGVLLGILSGDAPLRLPLVGALVPWQGALVVAGLPGLVVALLLKTTVREPPRRDDTRVGRAAASDEAYAWPSIRTYLRANRTPVGILGAAVGLFFLGTIGSGVWLPTFLIRTYGWTAQQAGVSFGLVLLVTATLGTLAGGRLTVYLAARGYEDANVRVLLYALIGLVPCRLLYPFMPTGELALVVLAPTLFLVSLPLGTLPAAVQNIFPNRMRAFATAVYALLVNLIGMGLGPPLIALTTDYLFQDPAALRYSLALVGPVTTALSLYFAARGLAPFRQSKTYAQTWKP